MTVTLLSFNRFFTISSVYLPPMVTLRRLLKTVLS